MPITTITSGLTVMAASAASFRHHHHAPQLIEFTTLRFVAHYVRHKGAHSTVLRVSDPKILSFCVPVIVLRTNRLSSVLNMKASLLPPDNLAAEMLARDSWYTLYRIEKQQSGAKQILANCTWQDKRYSLK